VTPHLVCIGAVVVPLIAISATAGCSRRASRSPEMIEDLSLLQPEITLTRTVTRHATGTLTRLTSIRAVIRDANGTAIEDRGVDLRVNGESLPFKVATGNYDDRSPFYERADAEGAAVHASTSYTFSIRLANGREAEVGRPTSSRPAHARRV
jgi:hypothetical protein